MMQIACLDVYYLNETAQAACVVFGSESPNQMIAEYVTLISEVNEYIPGEFYRRELPCLLAVLAQVKEEIGLVIVDSFVWLGQGKKGLGAHLYEALEGKLGVIGVAKTFFHDCTACLEVYRGESKKPLYVSTVGFDLNLAGELVKNLQGEYRIPEVLKRVDQLSRG